MLRALSERPLHLPRLRPYVPRPSDPAIFWFNAERDDILRTVVQRVLEGATTGSARMELALNDAAFHEVRRLEAQRDEESRTQLGYYRGLLRRIGRMSDSEKRATLEELITRFAHDVAGNFDPRVYALARRGVPKVITSVMDPSRLATDLLSADAPAIHDLLAVQGDVARLRALEPRGTLIYVPTHSSNLDSIVLAHALDRSDLAPVVYGAGKNLFTNPIISFFMHNLGAYRVDRRVRVGLYKAVLKAYSSVLIERGYHSLFFPGGTRSRSGLIERHLKLGLAGTGVSAFARNKRGRIARDVWFVPTTINYSLVLEAETLMEDWLSEEGRARYIIEDDEFSRIDRWVAFFRKLVGLHHACVIRFGDPVDPFGNPVDAEGRSASPAGRTIDPSSYLLDQGEIVLDEARDAAYTRELADVLVERYERETVIMTTQLVAHVLFRHLTDVTAGLDLFARLRYRGEIAMPREELEAKLGEARDALTDLEQAGAVHTSEPLRTLAPATLIARAIEVWNGYHSTRVASDRGDEVLIDDPKLLLYYQNRLVPYAERIAGRRDRRAAREIAQMVSTR
ncbi:MAG: 1-acyl-sn-glycerol-3-phosphate acyltransferase [Myxococcales bacterium]|nr:1-acyl-sn-glycerol-3-phosphate acyltransferase [Myxococcales bacterium]